VGSSCELGIEPSGPYNAGKLSSNLTTGGLSSSYKLTNSMELSITREATRC
jgi:hypothetical protein